MRGRNQATTAAQVSIVPVPKGARSGGDLPALPTIWWEPAPGRGRKRNALERRDLKTGLVAACERIRDLETKLAVLQGFVGAKIV